jgi:hypothetical protein
MGVPDKITRRLQFNSLSVLNVKFSVQMSERAPAMMYQDKANPNSSSDDPHRRA